MARSGPAGYVGQQVVRRDDHRHAPELTKRAWLDDRYRSPALQLTWAEPISEWRVVDGNGTVLARHRVPTPTEGSITDCPR